MRKCKHGKKSPIYYKHFSPITLQRQVNVKKDVFSFCNERGIKKNSDSPWGIEPQTFGFVLRCSTTEPQRLFGERGLLRSSTQVLYTARISSVDSVMFLIEIVQMVSFELTLVTRRKNIFLNSSPSSKLTISTISIRKSFVEMLCANSF